VSDPPLICDTCRAAIPATIFYAGAIRDSEDPRCILCGFPVSDSGEALKPRNAPSAGEAERALS
jgi:hypothetical protein